MSNLIMMAGIKKKEQLRLKEEKLRWLLKIDSLKSQAA